MRSRAVKKLAALIVIVIAASIDFQSSARAAEGEEDFIVQRTGLSRPQAIELLKARELWLRRRYQASVEGYDKLLRSLPPSGPGRSAAALILLWRAESLEILKQYQKAEADISQFLRLLPSQRWADSYSCRILSEAGKLKEAIARVKLQIFYAPNHAGPYACLAICSACTGDTGSAASNLTQALLLNYGKDNLEAANGPLCTTDSLAVLRKKCESELTKKPGDTKMLFASGLSYLLALSTEPAIDRFTLCLKSAPTMHEALIARAHAYINARKPEAALKDINQALALAPSDLCAYRTLGRYYKATGNFDKYFEDLDRRIAAGSKNAIPLIAKATAYEQLSESEKAIDCLNRAIRIDQNNAAALAQRGRLYLQLFKYGEAERDLGAAIKLQKDNPNFYRDRATCYLAEHKDRESIADITKVIELTGDPGAYAARAACYRRTGRADLAAADKLCADQNVAAIHLHTENAP